MENRTNSGIRAQIFMRENSSFQSLVKGKALGRSFYLRDTTKVAQDLLGKILVHHSSQGILAGLIVETEAYLSENDPASHTFRGETPRNAAMFLGGGTAYIYFIYGMHFCFNVVTNKQGIGEAVLIRAIEPLLGLDEMRRNRHSTQNSDIDLCRGPGRLARALGLTRTLNGTSLLEGPIQIFQAKKFVTREFPIVQSSRIGIRVGKEHQLRFYLKGSRFVSAQQ